MKTRLPTVALFVESSRESGRHFLRGVSDYARTHGRWSVYWQPSGLHAAWSALKSRHLDGMVLRDIGMIDEMLRLGIPSVVFGYARPEFPNAINVTTDSAAIARMAAEHLLACGFQHFAYCALSTATRPIPWCDARRVHFTARIAERGASCAIFSPPEALDPDWAGERRAMVRWLQSLPLPVACMAANDDRASELAAAAREAGLSVPDQVAIIGVDNDELVCQFSDPPLSSIAVGFERAGYEAAEALASLMQRCEPAVRTIVPKVNHLVIRRSTDFVASADSNMAKALCFIRDKAGNAMLSVSDVAQAAGLSRRSLERRFRETTGVSIGDHISKLRTDQVSRLLVETSLSIAEIATRLGFEGTQHFARYFRSQRGITPLAYRKQRAASGLTQNGD